MAVKIEKHVFDPSAPLTEPAIKTMVYHLTEYSAQTVVDRDALSLRVDILDRSKRQVEDMMLQHMRKFITVTVSDSQSFDGSKVCTARLHLPYVRDAEFAAVERSRDSWRAEAREHALRIELFHDLPWYKQMWRVLRSAIKRRVV